MPTVLVADDQLATRTHIASRLLDAGFEVLEAADGEEAWEHFGKHEPDLVVTDLRMPRCDGMELLSRIRTRSRVPVIILTAYGDIPTAVKAMKGGAEEFLSFDDLDVSQLIARVQALVRARPERSDPDALRARIAGDSPAMQRIRERVAGLLEMRTPALIVGEPGTGRDHVARVLHDAGPDAAHPFEVRPGSDDPGPESLPQRGTVYVDGVGDLRAETQRRWASWIRSGGEDRPRLVASMDEDPASAQLVPELADALARFRVGLPRLVDRLEDLPALCEQLIAEHARRLSRPAIELDAGALAELGRHTWPRNVRELDEVLEQLVAFSPRGRIGAPQVADAIADLREDVADLRGQRDRQQRDELVEALRRTGGNLSQAAELLGISRGALRHRARKHGLLPGRRTGAGP